MKLGNIKVILLGIFFTSCATFATMPFLTVYLKEYRVESVIGIGSIIAIPYLMSSILGFIGGKAGDIYGDKIIPISCLGMGVGFLLYGFITSLYGLIATSILIGVSKSVYEPAVKALLSDANENSSVQVFRLRYLAICAGAIIGPILGGMIYKINPKFIFILTFVSYAIFSLLFKLFIVKEVQKDLITKESQIYKSSFKDWVEPFTNTRLVILVFAGSLGFIKVVNFESILPLILSERNIDVATTFSIMFSMSAFLSIIIQIPLTFIAKKINQNTIMFLGNLSFCIAFVIFALSGSSVVYIFIAVAFYAIGESIVIPGNDILISDIAAEDKKASYFGFAELRQLGFSIGPIISTVSLEMFGGVKTLLYTSGLAIIAILCYLYLGTFSRLENIQERVERI